MKLFFKNLKEKEEENYFLGIQEREIFFRTRHGLKVVILSTATTTTDKQSSNCEFSLIFSTFTFHPSRIPNSLNIFPWFLVSHASSCRYGGAFWERYGENGTHSWHHSHLFPLETHLYIHFSSPLLSTHFSSPSFIFWKPNLFFWFWAYHHFLRRKM